MANNNSPIKGWRRLNDPGQQPQDPPPVVKPLTGPTPGAPVPNSGPAYPPTPGNAAYPPPQTYPPVGPSSVPSYTPPSYPANPGWPPAPNQALNPAYPGAPSFQGPPTTPPAYIQPAPLTYASPPTTQTPSITPNTNYNDGLNRPLNVGIYTAITFGFSLLGMVLSSAGADFGIFLLMAASLLWMTGAYMGFVNLARKKYLGQIISWGCIFWIFLGWWLVGLLAALGPIFWGFTLTIKPNRDCPACRQVIPGDATRCPHCQTPVAPIV